MKRIAASLIVGVLVAGVAVYGFGRRPLPSGPRAEYPALVDFGAILPDSSISGTLVVANTGGSPLHVTDLSRSCVCVQAELVTTSGRKPLGNFSVLPGESATIVFELRSQAGQFGTVREFLYFQTNDPQSSGGRVELTYRVKGAIAAYPTAVYFGSVTPGVPVGADVDIRASDPETTARSIRVAGPSADALRIESIPVGLEMSDSTFPARLLLRLRLRLVPEAARGSHEARVEIAAGDAMSRPLVVPVNWRVCPPVEVSPDSISLPVRSTSGSVYSARCVVRSSTGLPLRIAKTEVPDGFRVSVVNGGHSPPSVVAIITVECVDPAVLDRRPADTTAIRLTVEIGDGHSETVAIAVSRRKTS